MKPPRDPFVLVKALWTLAWRPALRPICWTVGHRGNDVCLRCTAFMDQGGGKA